MRKLKNTIDGNNDSQKKVSEEETVSEEKAPCDKQAASDKEAVSEEEKDSEDEAASESEEGEASDDDKTSKSFKSIFKSSKNKELEAKEQKIQELTDKLLRTMAEFDNYRKRTEKEKAQMFDLGVKSVIEKILPVVDNFERGLSSISEAEKDSALAQGYNMIYKQLMTLLDDMGVKPIEAVGKPFDPNYHNAVMHSEDENLGENIVAEEFQKGYMYKDMIVRHSMVRVVN
jgi:GrpE.